MTFLLKEKKSIRNSKNKKHIDTLYRILFILSIVHLFNDMIQALVTAMFPIFETEMGLSYTKIGFIAFSLNMTASVIQPVVGLYTDKRPMPYALPIGMIFTFIGVILLAISSDFSSLIISVILIGVGSATFHPEGSRVAHMVAGSKRGLAQSIFQVGGNLGQSSAPLITALLLVPLGQFGAIYFTAVVGVAIILLLYIATWYKENISLQNQNKNHINEQKRIPKKYKKKVLLSFSLLLFLVFVRSWFDAGISSYYQFYAIDKYTISISEAQVYLFIFLASGALGTFFGGPLSDKIGKKNTLIFSLVGAIPFALILPYASQLWAYPLISTVGFITFSGFSVAVVYAQELIPGKIGVVSGSVVGLAFGMGAIGSVLFGGIADLINIGFAIACATILPIIGILTFLLPKDNWVYNIYSK